MLRARSFTLALASRNEGLTAAVERDRVKVREVEALGADDARIFTAAKDIAESAVQSEWGKKLQSKLDVVECQPDSIIDHRILPKSE